MSRFSAGPYYLSPNEIAIRLTEDDDGTIRIALLGRMPPEGLEATLPHFVARDVVAFLLGRHDEMHADYPTVPRKRRRQLTVVPGLKSPASQGKGGE